MWHNFHNCFVGMDKPTCGGDDETWDQSPLNNCRRLIQVHMSTTDDSLFKHSLRDLLDMLPVAIFVKDAESRVVLMNRTCEDHWGIPFEAVAGTDASAYFPPEQIRKFKDDDRTVLYGGTQVDIREVYWNSKLRQNRHGRTLKCAMYDAKGQPQYLIAVTIDITDQIEAEAEVAASDEKLRGLYQLAKIGIALNSMDGKFLDFNPAFVKLTGYTAEELRQLDYWALTPREYEVDEAKQLQMIEQRGAYGPYEKEYIRKDGGRIPLQLNGILVRSQTGEKQIWSLVEDISERRRIERTLRESAAFARSILDSVLAEILVLDRHGKLIAANKPWMQHCASISESSGKLALGMNFYRDGPIDEGISGEDANRIIDAVQSICAGRSSTQYIEYAATPNGKKSWYGVSISPLEIEQGGAVLSRSDITARLEIENQIHLLANVFMTAREGIMITNDEAVIIDVNDSFLRLTGYEREELINQTPRILRSGVHGKDFYRYIWRDIAERGFWRGEIWNRRKNGDLQCCLETISAVVNTKGERPQYIAVYSDITALKEHQSQLDRVTYFDTLTGLPNRALFSDRLQQAMALADRKNSTLAVIYFDLDHFKAINDQYGHTIGDQLLIALATDLKETMRAGDTLARIGGDEFVAVLSDMGLRSEIETLLDRLLKVIDKPQEISNNSLRVSTSIGVTFYPQSGSLDADQLLRQADQAMYQAKLLGKNRFHIFDLERDRNMRGQQENQADLRRALAHGEFVLHYQPKVNMKTGEVVGAEALIRWQHPERGLLPPGIFLPLIEEHTLEIDIGEWVINQALTQIEKWKEFGVHLPVSVNVSARQLLEANFPDRLGAILASHPNVPPSELEIEILETSDLEDMARAVTAIERCRDLGISFALDDFGTGYSSLTYLKHLPVGLIKVDQSFVRDMLRDPDDLAILDGVLGMANAFRRKVIAEGMETEEHGTMLLQFGCHLAQGYGIARPMAPDLIPAWVEHWRPFESWRTLQRVSRLDLPLLYVSVDIRAWVNLLEQYAHASSEFSPPSQREAALFNEWLTNDGKLRYESRVAFQKMTDLYGALQLKARQLRELKQQNFHDPLPSIVESIRVNRDALLEVINELLSSPPN